MCKRSILTVQEKALLIAIPSDYKYLARNQNGMLAAFKNKPFKQLANSWTDGEYETNRNLKLFNELFKFIKFEDDEAYLINKLKKM